MRRFEFTLERLLRVKRRREWLAEVALAQARARLDEARLRVANLNCRLEELAVTMSDAVGQGRPSQQWANDSLLIEQLGITLRLAERKLEDAEKHVAEAAHARTRCAAEAEAMQTLRDQQWEQHRQDIQHAEQRRLDELSMNRWKPGQGHQTRMGEEAK